MTASDSTKIYQSSFKRIVEYEQSHKDFFDLFYHRFMSSSKEARDKFANTDIDVQVTLLKNFLVHLQVFHETGQPSEYLVKAAAAHGRKGHDIKPHLYNDWVDALMVTLKECDPEYTAEVGDAWRAILAPGIAFMKGNY